MSDESPVTEIPAEALSEEVLRRLVEEFVTRDGTDYGDVEASLDQKVEQVLAQIDAGEVKIVFDPETESANLTTA